jgi:hypothetical protein
MYDVPCVVCWQSRNDPILLSMFKRRRADDIAIDEVAAMSGEGTAPQQRRARQIAAAAATAGSTSPGAANAHKKADKKRADDALLGSASLHATPALAASATSAGGGARSKRTRELAQSGGIMGGSAHAEQDEDADGTRAGPPAFDPLDTPKAFGSPFIGGYSFVRTRCHTCVVC